MILCRAFLFSALLLHFADSHAQLLKNSHTGLTLRDVEALSDSAQEKRSEFKMKKNPWTAVLYSALLPGSGQYYNRSYWKIPVILGLGGYFVYGIVNNNNLYQDYKGLYSSSQTGSNPSGNPEYKRLRDFYKDQRDDFYIYSAILYIANLIDAYVDAHLFDFDVKEESGLNPASLNLKINF